MAIILPIAGPASGAPPIATPACLQYVGFRNYLQDGTITDKTGGDPLNAFDWKPWSFWEVSAGVNYFELEFDEAVTMDYIGVKFYQYGFTTTLALQYWDGAAWQDAVELNLTGGLGKSLMEIFDEVTATLWRVQVDSDAPVRIGMVSAGQWMGVPISKLDWTPPRLARRSEFLTNRSETGMFLGRSLERLANSFDIESNFVHIQWAYELWLEFVEHAEQYPFFFKWDIGIASDVLFCWVEEEIPPPTFVSHSYISVNMPVLGVI